MSRKVSGNTEARFLSTHLNPDSEQVNSARQIAWYSSVPGGLDFISHMPHEQ